MGEHIVYLTDQTFESSIASGVTLVDFYADWCGPCKMIAPIIEELSGEMHGRAKIAKLDVDTAQSVAAKYQITSIPTIILFKSGKEVSRIVGLRDKEFLKKMILDQLTP